MTDTIFAAELNVAPGSVVVVRDEEWLVTGVEHTQDGSLLRVQGLSELVRDTTAAFYSGLDRIEVLDPAQATVVADDSHYYRRSRLWLESTLRKTAVPLDGAALTVSTEMLADSLNYQLAAVRKALDPANLRTRILLADAVGLGKTLEIGMILAELIRRGRGERILIVSPRHVLEQMQHEMWCRFAIPFVRLDSVGIQRVRQKLPATRNPFTYFKQVIISIDTLKSDRYLAALRSHRWDAVVIDESHNLTNADTKNNRLARILAANTDALILASATPHNGKAASFAELIRLLEPTAVRPDGTIIPEEVQRLIVRRHRHSPEVAQEVGANWAERKEPQNWLVPASPAEDAIARELDEVWAKLPKALKLKDDQVVILHGGLTDEEQQGVVESFKQASSPIRVLVTGDVASEGVNLHSQCHQLIHFDIPWSLIRIEQRNGRIDRYGQRHAPQITTLLLAPHSGEFSGDLRVLSRLIDKEHEAHQALGDVASLMGKYDVAGEEEAIRKVLAGEAVRGGTSRTRRPELLGMDPSAAEGERWRLRLEPHAAWCWVRRAQGPPTASPATLYMLAGNRRVVEKAVHGGSGLNRLFTEQGG